MSGVVINVATDSYTVGQDRLCAELKRLGQDKILIWRNQLPRGSPYHRRRGFCGNPSGTNVVPYAFKAYAIREALQAGHSLILWSDASIVPLRPLDELWERIEKRGYWFVRNGWNNAQWTADTAYEYLFPNSRIGAIEMVAARDCNMNIQHVVATTFGLNLVHDIGRAFYDEYFRLASQTRAFCGPWSNRNASPEHHLKRANVDRPCEPCGPPFVLGHRHDQTAASVICWRLGMELDEAPYTFAYDGGEVESTVLVARGWGTKKKPPGSEK